MLTEQLSHIVARRFERRVRTPPPAPGFAGPGHTAVEVLTPSALAKSDPFVLLMDDRIDFAVGQEIGGEHPHAGLETVTLVLQGELRDRDEGLLGEGDVLWMNAGRGIIHNEQVKSMGKARILQLWIALPVTERNGVPSFELIRAPQVPTRSEPGVFVRLYSGRTGELRSATRNRVPVTMVDVHLAPGRSFEQDLPASYNGFGYVVEGSVLAGDEVTPLECGDVGWLDRPSTAGTSSLRLTGGNQGGRIIVYAGEPQRAPVIQHGPFVAGSHDDIARLHRAYRTGTFTRMSTLARTQARISQT